MNARDKANDLVNRYYYMLPNNGSINEGINSCESRYNEAIECAFVIVEAMITELTEEISPSVHGFRHQYWSEVKQWIQKIKDKEPGAQWTIEDMKQGKTIVIK